MKKLFLILASAAALASCGGKKGDDNINVPEGMIAVDLSKFGGYPLIIAVPDTLNGKHNGKLSVTQNPKGGYDVKVGKGFQLSITEGEGNMEMKKSDVNGDAVRKLVKMVVDEPNAILYEWQIEGMEPEFRFYAIVKAGNKSYEAEDVEGEVFGEKAATAMLNSAKGLKAKEKEKS